LGFRLVGTHASELTVGSPPPVTVPPDAVIGVFQPEGADAMLLSATTVELTPVAIVRFTTPTVPFEMMPLPPDTTQEYDPVPGTQLSDFPAAVNAAPALTETDVTFAAA